MRLFLTWLVVLGVFAGLQGRAFAVDPCAALSASHESQHSDHPHDSHEPCDPSHDNHCPLEHHNHHCFCHPMPLTDANDLFVRLSVPCFSLSLFRHEGEVVPDGPCLGEDKPPLI